MTMVRGYFRELGRAAVGGWNRFWFAPQDPATLGLIRIFAGAMLFYTHMVWSLDLAGFFGPTGWLTPGALETAYGDARGLLWSHWHWIDSPAARWIVHVAALVVFAMLTIGLFTRIVTILAWLLTVSYAHRVMPAALFGLDDINAMLAMYLMIGPSGAAYSLDSWLASRRGRAGQGGGISREAEPRESRRAGIFRSEPGNQRSASISANIAIRLMQLHLCIIYLFSGLGKAMGETWWDGSAMWLAIANYEYQSIDLIWLASSPEILSLFAHVTVAWELSYIALVWPRLTRPIVVATAVPIHLGIALFLGMMTFGLAMIIANLAFVSPWVVRAVLKSHTGCRAGQGRVGGVRRIGVFMLSHRNFKEGITMTNKVHRPLLAGCLFACVAAALAEESRYGSRPADDVSSNAPPVAKSDRLSNSLTRITLAMEVNEETCKDIVTAHEQGVRKLRDALDDYDSSGKPTPRAHLAAKTLVALNDREVIRFLVRNLDYRIPLPFSFTLEPVLEACPYITPLIQHEERGARVILDVVVRDREDTITEREWMFYGYVLVYVFGGDEESRHTAIAFIDQRDPQRTNQELNRLRENVRTVKRYFGR